MTVALVRAGFVDPAAAAARLEQIGPSGADPALVEALAHAADPDAAVAGLAALVAAAPDSDSLLARLGDDPEFRHRLVQVLGASVALAEHLARHPEHWPELAEMPASRPTGAGLRAAMLHAVGADARDSDPRATVSGTAGADALRVGYRRALLGIAARDLAEPSASAGVADVAAELADLAGATLEAALAVARADLPAGVPPTRLAVIAMGKCGGHELNYVSDVDVVFVAEPVDGVEESLALRTAGQLAAGMMRICSGATAEGTIWPVDAGLRPEGKAGPLVRTLASHLAYYERWAKTWEFQALLKARPVAGDQVLGRRYVDAILPFVWQAAERDQFVEDVQSMRRRVEASVPAREAGRQLKLGPGGLRDVEFAVQLLQLVHGRTDETLRSGSTLDALRALAAGGYVGRDDAASLDAAYRFLRALEHRIQLHRLRRTHVVPEAENELRRLGRSLGLRSDPVKELNDTWREHAREARRLHEKLFYRPLLQAVARLAPGEARLTPQAAQARLVALGYADPAGALRHLEALTSGMSRRAAIQRTLLPVMLGWFADAPDPDAGLLAFRQVSDALGSTHWYLRLLRDEGAAAQRMAHVLASSRYGSELLLRAPEAVTMLGDDDDLVPRPASSLTAETRSAVRRSEDDQQAVAAVRALRRRELLRTAVGDLVGRLDVGEVSEALTDVTAATLRATLVVAARAVERERGQPPTRLAVVAMGRLGGHEMGYGSDADVLFVHDPIEGASEKDASDAAHAVANELRRLLHVPGPDPALEVDADLRPEGRQGPLVRTLASYAAYYERWAKVWESQALLRAEPIAGDHQLGLRFVALVDPLRYPGGGLDDAAVREIRRIKARVESERLPRGVDPTQHIKLGPGGIADVEWVAQLLQLRHAHEVPRLRTTRTLSAVHGAVAAGLLSRADGDTLAAAWQLATRVRNAMVLVRGRPSDTLPRNPRELSGIARVLGYPPSTVGDLLDDYRRATRRARAVVDREFYA